MTLSKKRCRVCKKTNFETYPSRMEKQDYICKTCDNKNRVKRRKAKSKNNKNNKNNS